eukprot:Skav234496  [mRNA]  locus=scaffold3731:183884:184473:+ [translate_table: standard]
MDPGALASLGIPLIFKDVEPIVLSPHAKVSKEDPEHIKVIVEKERPQEKPEKKEAPPMFAAAASSLLLRSAF